MPYLGLKNKVFNRYNSAVVLVFIGIVLSAVVFGVTRYQSELNVYTKESLHDLSVQGRNLNTILEHSVQSIKGMQEFANHSLAYPQELSAKAPTLKQDGALFYLDIPKHQNTSPLEKRLRGNITGKGDIGLFDQKMNDEIAMANALTPAFITANMTIPEATWFYYLSFNKFVSIYPWIDRKNWHYSDKMLDNPYAKNIIQLTDKAEEYFWSPPYIDAAGSGLNTSLSLGVVRDNEVVGAVVIDINLASLQKNLPDFTSMQHGIVLLNKENRVLVYKHHDKSTLSPETSWQEVLPEQLSQKDINKLLASSDSQEIDGWLLQKYQLTINDWTLIKYQPYEDFTAPVFNRFMQIFFLFFSGLVAFLTLVYLLTRSTFIKPATDFMSHIEYCAQGDPGKIKPTADWLHWFNIVEKIFGQNRSLLQQLKDKNKELDLRVIEKTQALMKSSQHHQRDSALLRSVMNAMPELIIFNDNQNQLIGCNKAFEDSVNKEESAMLGSQVSEFMPSSLAKALIELSTQSLQPLKCEYDKKGDATLTSSQGGDSAVKDSLNTEYHSPSFQRVVETKSHTYEIVSRQFFNDTGISLGTINIFRDVTEQYEVQSALKAAKDQAEYANQAKNQFLANMSHEIRTPINAMQGMMTLLTKTRLNAHQLHYLANAQDASVSLLHLIDELLDLSKIEAGKMFITKHEANLDLIVNKALKLNLAMINNNALTLTVDIAPDVPQFVMTDEMRLVQVLTNLLNNSVKFTPHGKIMLSVELIANSEKNKLVRFSVSDNGIGIAKDQQVHLFDAFSQADQTMTREYGGSGLGLSICQQIVSLLGGEISIKSELGKGSEFSFVLPFVLPSKEQKLDSVLADKNVLLCSVNCSFSSSLVSAINANEWEHTLVDSLTEINKLTTSKALIILLDADELTEEIINQLELIINQPNHSVKLIAFCQEAMNSISSIISDRLHLLSVPYILLDKPLYRFSINEINNALSAECKSKQQLSDSLKQNDQQLIQSQALTQQSEEQSTQINEGKNLAGITVLLVEDNLVNQLVAKELLVSMQAKVIIADNGQHALNILAEHQIEGNEDKWIDIVLMDIQMPIMDGLTATRLIRQQPLLMALPIVAMTAHARAEDKENSYDAGMNLHIAKPINTEILLTSILRVLSEK